MTRHCIGCGFYFPRDDFPVHWDDHERRLQRSNYCGDCASARAPFLRIAAVAADGLLRLRAISALLYMGNVGLARAIADGLKHWPRNPRSVR